jgi:hypothetical protein
MFCHQLSSGSGTMALSVKETTVDSTTKTGKEHCDTKNSASGFRSSEKLQETNFLFKI